MIPLYGFLAGDSLGLLVLARPEDTAEMLCAKLQSAAALRVAPLQRPVVRFAGQLLHGRTTVTEANMTALQRFDVIEQGQQPPPPASKDGLF